MQLVNIITVFSLISVLWGLFYLIVPPKNNSSLYGIKTKVTARNENAWNYGQKLFAYCLIITGLVLFAVGISPLQNAMMKFMGVLILIIMWQTSKMIVHNKVEKKYPESGI